MLTQLASNFTKQWQTLYNVILCIARNLLEIRLIIKILNHPCCLWQYGLWSFQKGYTKLEIFLHKNQHTQRKLLNFENWTNGELQSHLICTLISENEDFEKLRSASNLRKISVPAHLIFFSVCHLSFFSDLYHRSEKNSGDKLKKNSGVQELKFF